MSGLSICLLVVVMLLESEQLSAKGAVRGPDHCQNDLVQTAANAADVTQACVLLHGDETEAWGDAGYQGVDKRPENRGCGVAWQVAMKPGKRRLLDRDGAEAAAEKRKASVRAKVEHPFLYVKRRFGYGKVRYRGLAKNTQRIALLLGFSNLLIAGRYATG